MGRTRHQKLKTTNSAKSVHHSSFSRENALKDLIEKRKTIADSSKQAVISFFNNLQLDEQCTRFKAWWKVLPVYLHRELAPVVPIAVAHLYIEAVANGANRILAFNFFKRHYYIPPLSYDTHPNNLLQDLLSLGIHPRMLTKPSVIKFRSGKTVLSASKQSVAVLRKYVSSTNHPYLIQMIDQRILFVAPKMYGCEKPSVKPPLVSMTDSIKQPVEPEGLEDVEGEPSMQPQVDALRAAIDDIENSLPIPGPMKVLNIMFNYLFYSFQRILVVAPKMYGCEKPSTKPPLVSMTDFIKHPLEPEGLGDVEEGEASIQAQVDALQAAIDGIANGPPVPVPMKVLNIMNCENNPVACATLSNKSTYLAAGLETGVVSKWSLVQDFLATEESAVIMSGHTGPIRTLAWLGKNIVSGSVDSDIRLWTPKTNRCASTYRGHKGFVYGLAVSPVDTYFVSVSSDETMKLWSPEFAYPLRSYWGHIVAPTCVDYHPNGLYLASGSLDRAVRLWDARDGRLLRLYSGHQHEVQCVAFSPDGKSLASGGSKTGVRIWDLARGTCRLEIPVPLGDAKMIAWSQDSSCLAFASSNNAVTECSVTGEPCLLAEYKTGCLSVLALSFNAFNITCVGTKL